MRIFVGILVGLVGVLGCLMALACWIDPVSFAGKLGLEGLGGLGHATLRADVAGFFAVAGVLALAGAVRGEARLVTAPLLLIALALVGRLITVGLEGFSPEMTGPIVVEAVLLGIFAAGRGFIGARG